MIFVYSNLDYIISEKAFYQTAYILSLPGSNVSRPSSVYEYDLSPFIWALHTPEWIKYLWSENNVDINEITI